MTAPNYTAGIFVADDKIIFGFLPKNHGILPSKVSELEIDEFDCSENTVSDLIKAVRLLHDQILKIREGEDPPTERKIYALTLAVPGPIPVSGRPRRNIDRPEYGITNSFNRRKSLRNQNLIQLLRSEINKRQYSSFVEEPDIFIYHDAAAFAFGEYNVRRINYINEGRKYSNQKSVGELNNQYKDDTLHVQILVDEGIGGAIVAYNAVAQHNMHSEFGHIIVPRHPREETDFEATCSMHHANQCVESFIGLPALRKRYGDDFLTQYEHWEPDNKNLNMIVYYLSHLIMHLIVTVAPTRIVLCGRVADKNQHLEKMVRGFIYKSLKSEENAGQMFPGYTDPAELAEYISRGTEPNSGVYGCAALAWTHGHDPTIRQNHVPISGTKDGYVTSP